jgi:phage gpG-like protein
MADPKNVRGVEKLKKRIATIRRSLDVPEMTSEIGVLLTRRTMDRFDREVDPNERPWPELAEVTLAARRRGGKGTKKLVRTGRLRRSIRPIRGGIGTVFGNTGAGFRIGIEDKEVAKYAGPLNRGNPAKKLPARRFLGIGPLDIRAVDSLMRRRAELAMRE